jgi:hypothetical protein
MTVVEFDTGVEEAADTDVSSLALLDARTDVLGSRLAFDVDAFQEARATAYVPKEVNFRVVLRSIDVTKPIDAKNVIYNFEKDTQYNTWRIVLPVYDCLEFSEESIATLNSYLYRSIRYIVQLRDLIYLYHSPTLGKAAFTSALSVMQKDAGTCAKKLLDGKVSALVPSSQPSILDGWELDTE